MQPQPRHRQRRPATQKVRWSSSEIWLFWEWLRALHADSRPVMQVLCNLCSLIRPNCAGMTSGDCSWKIARLWFWWCCAWEVEQRRPDQIIPRIDDAAWGFWCWNWPKEANNMWMSELTGGGAYLEPELTEEGEYLESELTEEGGYLDVRTDRGGRVFGFRTDQRRCVFGVRTDRRRRVFGIRTDRRRHKYLDSELTEEGEYLGVRTVWGAS